MQSFTEVLDGASEGVKTLFFVNQTQAASEKPAARS
jgi:hypothetical protein